MTPMLAIDRMMVHPVRMVPAAFAAMALIGTALLMLPQATVSGDPTRFVDALFTAVSALCVTGLVTLDTGSHWSLFGQGVILALIQAGGLGLMLIAALLIGLIAGPIPIAQRRLTGTEVGGMSGVGDVRNASRLIFKVAIMVELVLALWLASWLWLGHGVPPVEALWSGVFHAISAYNNAGFGLYPDSLMRFAGDPLILGPVAIAVIIGGIGFPVLWDIRRRFQTKRRHQWSLHSRLTLLASAIALLVGVVAMLLFETGTDGVMADLSWPARLLNALFHSVSLRTAGFNAVDMAGQSDAMLIVSSALMLIGGGAAGTAGGIKLTTAALLVLILLAELRGQPDVALFGRRVSHQVQRRAVSVILIAMGLLVAAVLALSAMTDLPTRDVAFEAVSAFATVGLSTGITAQLNDPARFIIIALMFIGRIGPVTLGAALLLRQRPVAYRYPEEDPIVG
jgi:trk system potassium uptake protein